MKIATLGGYVRWSYPLRAAAAALSAAAVGLAVLPSGASSQVDVLPQLNAAQILDIALVEAPPPGVGLKIHADFPAEAPLVIDGVPVFSLTADISPTGVGRVEHAVTAQEATPAKPSGKCKDPTFKVSSALWRPEDLPVRWQFNHSSTPGKMKPARARRAIKKAYRVWPEALTDCKKTKKNKNSFGFAYEGNTTNNVAYDGVNIIEFGSLGAEALALNYTWYQQNRILEVDMRLNKTEYPWTLKPGNTTKYHVKNVVTHELGHQVGLEDLNDPHGGLTMFGRINRGETHKQSLGRGDLKGAARIAP